LKDLKQIASAENLKGRSKYKTKEELSAFIEENLKKKEINKYIKKFPISRASPNYEEKSGKKSKSKSKTKTPKKKKTKTPKKKKTKTPVKNPLKEKLQEERIQNVLTKIGNLKEEIKRKESIKEDVQPIVEEYIEKSIQDIEQVKREVGEEEAIPYIKDYITNSVQELVDEVSTLSEVSSDGTMFTFGFGVQRKRKEAEENEEVDEAVKGYLSAMGDELANVDWLDLLERFTIIYGARVLGEWLANEYLS
jgi:hypothetical protein